MLLPHFVTYFFRAALLLALEMQTVSGPKLVEWKKQLKEEGFAAKIAAIRAEVEAFAKTFPMPGHPLY